jgi:RNA polymerase sigma factor for flagellar operon FliA
MLDELRSLDWVPRLARSRHRRLAEVMQAMETATGREPTEAEVAKELHIPENKVREMMSDSKIVGQISLEYPVSGAGDRERCVGDSLANRREEDPARHALQQELKRIIQQGLSRSERLVILLYYYEGMTMLEIGATLELSESRVSQMHSELMIRLRANLEAKGTTSPAAA